MDPNHPLNGSDWQCIQAQKESIDPNRPPIMECILVDLRLIGSCPNQVQPHFNQAQTGRPTLFTHFGQVASAIGRDVGSTIPFQKTSRND